MKNQKKKIFPYLLITIDYQRTVIFRRVPNTQTLNNIFFQIGQQNTVPNIFCLLSSLKTFGDRTFFFLHNLLFGKHKHSLKKVKKGLENTAFLWKLHIFILVRNYILIPFSFSSYEPILKKSLMKQHQRWVSRIEIVRYM